MREARNGLSTQRDTGHLPIHVSQGGAHISSALRQLSPHRERDMSPYRSMESQAACWLTSTLTVMSERTGVTSNWVFVLEC